MFTCFFIISNIKFSIFFTIWDNFSKNREELIKIITRNEMVINPFALSSIVDDAKIQLNNSKTYAQDRCPKSNALSKINNSV